MTGFSGSRIDLKLVLNKGSLFNKREVQNLC